MRCLDCDCEMGRIRLNTTMLVDGGRFGGRAVESLACPICGKIELRVAMPAGMREAFKNDPELRKAFGGEK